MKIQYENHHFRKESLDLIDIINAILVEYDSQGFELTLRQVYYQLVARGYIPNNEKSYKNVGNLISDARKAGLIDWCAIIDRNRNLRRNSHWDNPESIIGAAYESYHKDKWANQPYYVEVWVEKDALIDIVGQTCAPLDVPYFSCRGYSSSTELWQASQRIIEQSGRKDGCFIIYLGDHDPSGLDMTRDIKDRMQLFKADCEVKRIALSMDQISQYNPPPNPAKITDTRCNKYISKYGEESWELDALEPAVLSELIRDNVLALRDERLYREAIDEQEREQQELLMLYENYDSVIAYLAK